LGLKKSQTKRTENTQLCLGFTGQEKAFNWTRVPSPSKGTSLHFQVKSIPFITPSRMILSSFLMKQPNKYGLMPEGSWWWFMEREAMWAHEFSQHLQRIALE
jgi:hypothetical protein